MCSFVHLLTLFHYLRKSRKWMKLYQLAKWVFTPVLKGIHKHNYPPEAAEDTWDFGAGGTDDGVHVSMHALGGLGACSPRIIKCSEIASKAILYPNATSPTRVTSGNNNAIFHNTLQSSRGISVTVVDLVHARPDEVGILQMNCSYFLLYFWN